MVDQISVELTNNPTVSNTEYSGLNTAVDILEVANISIEQNSNLASDVVQTDYSLIEIDDYDIRFLEAADILPFRVAFENIWITGYGPGHPAPIGIAIIGYSNYIL